MRNKNNQQTFGQCIKSRRFSLKLTQTQVAGKLGVGQNFIAYLESDQRRPSNEVLKGLAECLSLPVDQLFLLVHPDVEEIFPEEAVPAQTKKPMDSLLIELRDHQPELRQKYSITNEDIDLLSSIQPRGKISRLEDYIFLLMTIRQVFREEINTHQADQKL